MAETGCLKDGHFQNLQVEGRTEFTGNMITSAGLILGIQNVTAAGNNQGDAGTILADGGTVVHVTDANNTAGVILPTITTAQLGKVYLICNDLSNMTLEVYPGTGDAINPASTNNPITIAADTILLLIALDDNQWFGAELPVVT